MGFLAFIVSDLVSFFTFLLHCIWLYRFRMKCHLCPNHIEMQTDPATCDYVIVSGARRKEERWDAEASEQVVATGEFWYQQHP